MYKQTQGILKGLGIGIAASAAAVMIGSKVMKGNRRLRRKANKAMHTVEGVIGNVEELFR